MHNGFYEAADVAYEQVLDQVQPLRSGRKLWVTGHSLGGAIATITAFRMEHDDGIDVQGVHDYGAPPVGNGVWQIVYEDQGIPTWRWNVEQDPVPVLYPEPALFHVGVYNNISLGGSIERDASTMLGYVPGVEVVDDLMGKHMSYWTRIHDYKDVVDLDPAVPQVPEL